MGTRAGTRRPGREARAMDPRQKDALRADLDRLWGRIARLTDPADAGCFARAAEWALRYEPDPRPDDLAQIARAIRRGDERAAALEAGRSPWAQATGRLVRGYRSRIDDSFQPYGLVVPAGYDPARPIRLDVVLHGSLRPVGMSELRLIAPFDRGGDAGGEAPPGRAWIELHPVGRVENCYRWAGETDVWEAIEDVCRRYAIDRDRIVLRGMSMGASGTWHLGLKRPDRFVALGPYCGYVDTHRFSETPGMDFVKVGPLPAVQEDGLHLLDSVDYAANAGMVPAIAAMGEKDPFFEAHVLMGEALRREGLALEQVLSPGTGHVQDPVAHAEQLRRIGVHARRGLDRLPPRVRFVTWSLKYARCHWVELLALERHYRRAEIDARVVGADAVEVAPPLNVARFALHRSLGSVRIAGRLVPLPDGVDPARGLVFERRGEGWRCAGARDAVRLSGKRPGVQGPIDDAFTDRFLCVRGTGRPWNPQAAAWADAALERFVFEFARWFRGDPRVTTDREVSARDRRTSHLICFGDPGSNRWVAEAARRGPVRWSRREVGLGGPRVDAAGHVPAWIAPSPWADDRYVVVNSGHTFHAAELDRLNYLLFPRHGDWALFRTDAAEPVRAGWFDERWQDAGSAASK